MLNSSQSNGKVNIFEYNDFRSFLKDFQDQKKKENSKYTVSYFSRKLGMRESREYFSKIVKGKVKLTDSKMAFLLNTLGLTKEEEQFFRALVHFNQAENPDEKDFYFESLIGLNKTPKRIILESEYEYYSKWHNSAIRALLESEDFKDDFKAIAGKLVSNVSTAEAKASIKLLKKLKLIEKNEKGYWKPTERVLSTEKYVKNEFIRCYQKEILELAKKSLYFDSESLKNISTMTLGLSGSALRQVETKLQKFKSEVRSIVHKDQNQSEKVYQLNINLFPQTK